MTTKYPMQKSQTHAVAKPGAPFQKPITVKHVMVLDTGDGAFTDESVKTKPFEGDDRKLMLKCTNKARLIDALKRLGLAPASPVFKGSKHFLVAVWKDAFTAALGAHAQQAHALGLGNEAKALSAKSQHAPSKHKQLVAKK